MTDRLTYTVESAIDPGSGERRFVVVGSDEVLHREASQWLDFLTAIGRSPNTIREYGRRMAWFLTWCSGVVDWRRITVSHLVMWRRALVADSETSRGAGAVAICGGQTVLSGATAELVAEQLPTDAWVTDLAPTRWYGSTA